MKKITTLIAAAIAVLAGTFNVQAQTDVTATYLTNAGFDNSCNYLTTTTASNLASGSTNNQTINGWTLTASAGNTASSTFEYGYAGTLNVSGAYGTIPSQGPDAATGAGHGSLGISAAWASAITYYQDVTLPAGKYTLEYAAYNSGPNATAHSKMGWVPSSGTSVISGKTSFTQAAWSTETLTFTVASATTGKIQVGVGSPNAGSGSVGRIFIDYVKLTLLPVDKAALNQLKDSATVIYNNPQPVGTSTAYTDLNTAIAAAQVVYDNASATAEQVLGQEVALKTAIANVYSAILIQQRVSTWTTLPYDATSVITNPSFETNSTTGWTNVGGFVPQNNTSFAYKAGTYYVEKWKSSGNWTGLKLSQKIVGLPNGVYNLTAAALNNPNTTGGAYVFANAEKAQIFATNDYSITVTVTNNELEIGYEVVNGGNYVAVDNFRLTYVSDGSPYVILAPSSLFFDPNNLTKSISVTGGNLTSNLDLNAPSGITLDKTTLTPAEVAAGATVTATFDNATAITNGTISATSGTVTQNISVNTSADLSCFTPLYPSRPNLIPTSYLNDISAFGGWGNKSVVFGEAFCGAACVKFNATTNTYPNGAALDVSPIAWAANSAYRVKFTVKTTDGTLALLAKGTNPDFSFSIPQTTDQWITVDTIFTTGAAPTTDFISINNVDLSATGKIAYIDNYELYNITDIDARLKSLTLDAGTLSPAFSSAITTYSVTLPSGTTSVTPTAVADVPAAVVTGAGTVDVTSGSGSSTIVVTATDLTTTKTYTVNYIVGNTTGIENADQKSLSVIVIGQQIKVQGTVVGDEVKVYTVNGHLVQQLVASSDVTPIDVKSGVYLIKVNGKVFKVVK